MRRYKGEETGMSRTQLTRLIRQHRETERVEDGRGKRRRGRSSAATGRRTSSCWRRWTTPWDRGRDAGCPAQRVSRDPCATLPRHLVGRIPKSRRLHGEDLEALLDFYDFSVSRWQRLRMTVKRGLPSVHVGVDEASEEGLFMKQRF